MNGLLHRFPDLAALVGDDAETRDRPGIVHRLDRGTSGVMMVGRSPAAVASLQRQLAQRRATRIYVALVEGTVHADRGSIDAPIGRDRRDPTRMAVDPSGRPAVTHYEVLGRSVGPDPVTLLRCTLESGRTHQIRVHLASIGHPVVGDGRYASTRSGAGPGDERPMLHAWQLSCEHPGTGSVVGFEAPFPADLVAAARERGLELPASSAGPR